MEGIHTVPYVNLGGNLYRHKPTATLPIEAERLTHNRQLIADALAHDPASWHGGWGNIDVINVLFANAVSTMLAGSMIARVAG